MFLIRSTSRYVRETQRLADLNEKLLRGESERWLLESRPYIHVTFRGWHSPNGYPIFSMSNAGEWSAVNVAFEGADIEWTVSHGFPIVLKPRDECLFFRIPNYRRPTAGSTEFRLRYRDVGLTREFAEKWRLEADQEHERLILVNSTIVQITPPTPEAYVLERAPEDHE